MDSSLPPASTTTTSTPGLTIVLPGDDVTDTIETWMNARNPNHDKAKKVAKLGDGLRRSKSNDRILATRAGRLEHIPKKNVFFILHNAKRYLPPQHHLQDRVIGIVEDRVASDGEGGDVYRIHIGGSHTALLSNLSCEGATKRNKPQWKAGTLLYARVEELPPSMDPILSCQNGPHDGGLPRKDWMTNEGTYGELHGGTCQSIPIGLARELLDPRNVVLDALASASKGNKNDGLAFEIAVGVNGYLWVHSQRPEYTILIVNAILNSQVLTEAQVRGMVQSLKQTIHEQLQQEKAGNDFMDQT